MAEKRSYKVLERITACFIEILAKQVGRYRWLVWVPGTLAINGESWMMRPNGLLSVVHLITA